MSEHIRRIIMGSDLTPQAEVRPNPDNGQQVGYPGLDEGGESGVYRTTLTLFLTAFVKAHQLGRVFGDEVSFNLDHANPGGIMAPVAPAISFVSFERLPADAYEDVTLEIAPDLLVEATLRESMGQKAAHYLARGVGLVWLVDTRQEEMHTFSAARPAGEIVGMDTDLCGEGLLDGFCIPVRAIFTQDEALQVEILGKLIGR